MKGSGFTSEWLAERGLKPTPGGLLIPAGKAPAAAAARPKAAIRVPSRREPNATEARWAERAFRHWPGVRIRYEALSFRMLSGALYTPDFTGWIDNKLFWACEVKGAYGHGSHSRSALAWKTAAHEWPSIAWIWARWKGGEWLETTINPQL